jgi:hypothetical protein
MQKLVTIYLDREGYRIRGERSPEQSHGIVEEHLEDYFTAGWEIKSIAGGGAGGGIGSTSAIIGCSWVVVLLEKP